MFSINPLQLIASDERIFEAITFLENKQFDDFFILDKSDIDNSQVLIEGSFEDVGSTFLRFIEQSKQSKDGEVFALKQLHLKLRVFLDRYSLFFSDDANSASFILKELENYLKENKF